MNKPFDFEAMPEHRSLPEEFSDICVSEEARHILIKRVDALANPEADPAIRLEAGMWKFFTPVFHGTQNDPT